MSLLLEALKKAELAKQGAEPLPPPPEPERETRLEPSLPSITTRQSLPDITQAMEIHAEELHRKSDKPPQSPAPEPPPQAAPDPEATAALERPAREEPPAPDAGREAARQVFEAKEEEYDPRWPFRITLAALIAAGVGYGGYVWWQMQPRYAVPAAASAKPVVAPAAVAPPAPAPAPLAAAPDPRAAAGAAAAKPSELRATAKLAATNVPAAAAAAPAASPASAPVFVAAREARPRRVEPAPARVEAENRGARTAEHPAIAVTPATLQADAALESAFAAYRRGDLEGARDQYERIVEREPNNRDALLGLAAIDARARRFETAELRYLKLLELNPRDTHAHAGLLALLGGAEAVQSESRIKSLLAAQPDATHLYFTLGNVYAAQSRWPEAQQAYFKAFSAEPDNADYVFNLAVSLDQLRQRQLAAQHYRKALALALARPHAFDRAQAEARARELER